MSKKKMSLKDLGIIIGLSAISVIVVCVLIVTGIVQYSYNTVICGHSPIAVIHYFGSQDLIYSKPGDSAAGPNMFAKYVCTEQDALDLGAKYKPSL